MARRCTHICLALCRSSAISVGEGRTRLVEQKRKEIVERYKPEVEKAGSFEKG